MALNLREYARLGAQARLQELQQEAVEILRNFPDLRGGESPFPKSGRGRARAAGDGGMISSGRPAKRKRPAMSAAQRKAVSARMKKYWAARRKAKAAKKA